VASPARAPLRAEDFAESVDGRDHSDLMLQWEAGFREGAFGVAEAVLHVHDEEGGVGLEIGGDMLEAVGSGKLLREKNDMFERES
jgi:hypothetical protein